MNYKIKDIPEEERPRERLVSSGVANLSNTELLSIILKTGTKNRSVSDLAVDVLKEVKNISNLQDITLSKLESIKGIGRVKAIEVLAAVELGRRIFTCKSQNKKVTFRDAKSIWRECRELFINKKQECFYCLYFNNKQELIERKLLFMGTINRSVVHPREIFREAYLLSASSIICLHNHPSGDVKPSMEDIRFTKNIVEIGKIQGIPVLDHLIVTEDDYYSFYENKNIL